MLVTETAWGKRIKTDVLILGTGASGVGAALRAAELKADVLMVGQGGWKAPAASAAATTISWRRSAPTNPTTPAKPLSASS